MKYIISYLSVFVVIIFAAACSEIADDITTPQEVNVHQQGVLNSSSNNFHGKIVGENGFNDCQQCHAADFAGGTAGQSCVDCHSSIAVHQDGLKSPSSPNFHGKFFAPHGVKMSECSDCHGVSFEGSSLSPSCDRCHSGISVHKEGIKNPTSPNFHGKFIKAGNWNLEECSQCHSENYAGGLAAPTCNTCHSDPGGPESCNTCHGDFADANKIAPPKDLSDNTAITAAGVGAHSAHLINTTIGNVACENCHIVPNELTSSGHIDSTPKAEVTFHGVSGNGTYSSTSLTCQNTYCHGNFEYSKANAPAQNQFAYIADKMTGNNFSPIWNKVDDTQAACGTCHGLPPTGHIEASISACSVCHRGVVDNEGNIIDKTKHINGQINVFED